MSTIRTALIFLLVILAGRAEAYPPSGVCWTNSFNATCHASAVAAATAAMHVQTGCPSAQLTCNGPIHDGSGSTSSQSYFWSFCATQTGQPTCTPSGFYVMSASGTATCPNGGTLTGGDCVCAGGETDTGSACVADCPGAGTALGLHNITIGWALSGVPDAPDTVGAVDYGLNRSHCLPEGAGYCGGTVDIAGTLANTDRHCWRSSNPEPTGLYRESCDMVFVSTGSACTADPTSAADPGSTSPSCPGGSGTFNGKPICLGVVGNSVQLPKPEGSGNPRAGTSPVDDSNAAREPSTGNGGGPDARGGPGVTVGGNGSIGTGNNATPGTGGTGGSGEGIEFPTDYNREATQASVLAELKKARKIDETGTPTGEGIDTEAKAALDGEATKLTTSLSGVVAGEGAPDRSWGFGITFPSNCSAISVGTANWGFYQVDFCEWQDIAHDLMSLVWIAATLFACFGMVSRAISGG